MIHQYNYVHNVKYFVYQGKFFLTSYGEVRNFLIYIPYVKKHNDFNRSHVPVSRDNEYYQSSTYTSRILHSV
jgi:hypothetical protein